jgi:protein phosphatase-4 regulatory subunit 3
LKINKDDFESTKMIKHRQFFTDQVNFKNLLNITNKDIIEKIHMNHRLTYLRDTATGRFIEEVTIRSINSILNLNNTEIIQYFLTNENLLKSIIDKIKDEDLEIRSQGISFLVELISCGKDIVKTNKLRLF